ncbi:MAG TPA: efflux RND transporter periplasmic adaptor subunit [Luteibacter sp.]|jgi:membrane fusion protein, multidrug efflux system|nr:efflux RND transporter periplasmic adaptor subunit [Luteibacter sp.]
MKKKLVFATAAGAVVVIAALTLGGSPTTTHAADQTAPPAPEVTVAQVLVRSVDDADQFTGRLQAVNTIDIRPRVNGYVNSVEFTEGALVKKGQLLFRIDPRPYQAQVDKLAANLTQAKSEAALADANAARAGRLLAQHAVSSEEAQRQQTAALSARSQIAATEAALEAAQLDRSFTEVRSPIDGRVSNAAITLGNLVTPSDVLTSVVSVNPVYAYFDVDEQSFLKLDRLRRDRGQAPVVAMGLANEDGYPHTGKIDFVDNQLRAGSGTIRLRAVFDNADGTYTPGLYARIQLRSAGAGPRALIDDRAVGTDLGNKFVYVVGKDKKVAYRRVTTGPLVDGLRVIDDGLVASDVIVVNGLQHLRPGVEVVPKTVAMDSRRQDDGRQVAQTTKPSAALADANH